MSLGPLDRRHPALIAGILGAVYDRDPDAGPLLYSDLLDVLTADEWTYRTISNTVEELSRFGAVRRAGRWTRLADPRTLYPTTLGRAWLDQQIPPPPGHRTNQKETTT